MKKINDVNMTSFVSPIVPPIRAVLGILLCLCVFSAQAIEVNKEPKLQAIVDELVAEGHYTNTQLLDVFKQAEFQQSVLDAMQNPAEYKFTWGKYRNLFIQPDRVNNGVDFWREHRAAFDRAEKEFGVPASVIVAIIGVESKFGKYKGKHKVLDSLVTLVTGFPRRSKFFAGELKQFLILTKENQLDTLEILGSYAGAVGFPQFISSSYRNYAIDFSGDGKVDLINQPIDAIGSVANYFVKNGWLTGKPVTSPPLSQVPVAIAEKANRKRKIQFGAESLRALGAPLAAEIDGQEQLNVLMLNANPIVPEPDSQDYYIVRAGDTACQIAERFEVSCKSLFEANKIGEDGTIFRDQRLTIPRLKRVVKAAPSSTSGNSKSNSKWQFKEPSAAPAMQRADAPQEQFFFTHENFYVITRYNHSVLYAMAVHDLSQAVQQEIERQIGG